VHKLKTLFFSIFLLLSGWCSASHIIGGDIYYDYLGNNQYRFFITLYRDCASTGAQFDNPLYLSVFTQGNNHYQTVQVPFPGSVVLPINFNNPCATQPTGICVERAIYQVVLTLPPIPGGYTVSYQRCCRGPNITNLQFPDDTGLTLVAQIPGSNTGASNNSSPRFTNYPPVLLCNNDQLVFDHVATDPDGDQLVYSLVTPFAGANSGNPQPLQMPPPPYFPVTWQPNFNATVPLGPGSSTIIHPSTGLLTVNPNLIGLFVVGVRVQEYRNGQLIGETIRDFLFRVFDCNIQLAAILPQQPQLPNFSGYCSGLTVQFDNQSFGGTNYSWDFGVPGTTADVSNLYEPTYTYPSSGTYTAQVIVNPGQNCTDTAYIEIIVNEPLELEWQAQDSLCLTDNSFDFTALISDPNATLTWSFPPSASTAQANGFTVPNVVFDTAGFHSILLEASSAFCQLSYLDSIFIFGEPTAGIVVPPQVECLGYTIQFGNNSQNSIQYAWDFGNGQTSTQILPTATFPGPGIYPVSLIAGSSPTCLDTILVNVPIGEPIVLSMSNSDSLCIDDLFSFDAQVSGPIGTNYWWDFGPNANPSTSTQLTGNNVLFDQNGNQQVMLIGQNPLCTDTLVELVRVFGHPTINFMFLNSLQCAPSQAQFVNLSQSEVPTTYLWDLGDGTQVQATNVLHTYSQPGDYTVTLTLIEQFGCLDTLFMAQQDVVTVHPSPQAGFAISPDKVDVCQNEAVFTDLSVDAVTYQYFVEDYAFQYTTANFVHAYQSGGTDYPYQVVSNAFGCTDTAYSSIEVEPFSIYAPNSFIPDANGRNDIFKVVTDFDVSDWSLEIFNRWGERVFVSQNANEGWDGTYNGFDCQDGLYNYVLKFRPCHEPYIRRQREGVVHLLR
jgi:gliding motility-associated-like protein